MPGMGIACTHNQHAIHMTSRWQGSSGSCLDRVDLLPALPLASRAVDADVAVVGAGPSGALAALRLLAAPALRGLRIVVLDREQHPMAGRWWTYWGSRAIEAGADSGTWDRLRLWSEDRQVDVALGESRYRRLDGDRLADRLESALSAAPRARREVAVVEGIAQSDSVAVLRLSGGRSIGARWVLDSTSGLAADEAGPWLSFLGVHVGSTQVPRLPDQERDIVGLMDFRVPQRDGLRFGFVLPDAPGRSLLELCSFRYGGPDPDLEPDLVDWAARHGAGPDAAMRLVESYAYPLVTRGSRRRGPRVLAIGHRGGLVRASTGYGVSAYARDAEAIAQSLARHGHPFAAPSPSRRDALLDRVALEALRHDPATVQRAYLDMFATVPTDRVLRFLDGAASGRDVVAIARAMPQGPFLRASARLVARGRHWAPGRPR